LDLFKGKQSLKRGKAVAVYSVKGGFAGRPAIPSVINYEQIEAGWHKPEDSVNMCADVLGVTVESQNSPLGLSGTEKPAVKCLSVSAGEKQILRGEPLRNRIRDRLPLRVKEKSGTARNKQCKWQQQYDDAL
jgi:hypothetical protein